MRSSPLEKNLESLIYEDTKTHDFTVKLTNSGTLNVVPIQIFECPMKTQPYTY